MNVGGSRAPAGSYSCGSRGLGPFTSRHRDAGKSGYYTDSDTGLVLCGARFYLPALGRFLTQDPIGQSGGLNLYEYCGDNPINKLDPRGTDPWDNLANFFGGWGRSLTFGATGAVSQLINRSLGNGEFEYGGEYFTAGQIVGAANGLAISGAGGLGAVGALRTSGGALAQVAAKMAYGLGEATGTAHNIERSVAMYRQLRSIGFFNNAATSTYLARQFMAALRNPSSVAGVAKDGTVTREFLLMGPQGGLKVESYWTGSKLLTYKFFGGRF